MASNATVSATAASGSATLDIDAITALVADGVKYYTENDCGNTKLAYAQLVDILGGIATEIQVLLNNYTRDKPGTPRHAYAETILFGLDALYFYSLFEKIQSLLTYTGSDFTSRTIGNSVEFMNKCNKEDFDPKVNIHFAELDKTLDETQLFTLLKTLRMYINRLFFFVARSYSPYEFDPSNASFRTGGKDGKFVTSVQFVDYATELNDIYIEFYEGFSEDLSEFKDMFKAAASASKELSEQRKMRTSYTATRKFSKKPDEKSSEQDAEAADSDTATAAAATPAPVSPKATIDQRRKNLSERLSQIKETFSQASPSPARVASSWSGKFNPVSGQEIVAPPEPTTVVATHASTTPASTTSASTATSAQAEQSDFTPVTKGRKPRGTVSSQHPKSRFPSRSQLASRFATA